MEKTSSSIRWTDSNIIDLVRRLRNELIKDFLDEHYLKEYLASTHGVKEISNIKIEFIRRNLKELLIAPVDIQHYQKLILQIKETDTASLSHKNESLFYEDVDRVFKNYIYT